MKRYWSSVPPEKMTPKQKSEWDAFDAKLTPEDIVEMQTIDADCNDCKHFHRGARVAEMDGLYQKSIKLGRSSYSEGTCEKDGSYQRAHPCYYKGKECFEHRREI